METEKKPESSWGDPEQLGPYQLREQVPQSTLSQGELYRATHETSGATALVLKPAAKEGEGAVPLTDWRVRCTSSASPGYFAVEVEHSPWSDPNRHSVEELVCMFEDVRDGVGRMDQAFSAPNEPHPGLRLGPALAGAAALVLALLPAALAPVNEEQVQESTGDAWATDVNVDPVPVQAGEAPRPVKNQKRAPCTAGLEVEVSGACWLRIENRPCPPQTVTYQGYCLLPVAVPRPPVTSLDGGDGSEPR